MTQDLITVVTPTLGDSCGHLNRQMFDLRSFTRIPFKQIVCDDGTIEDEEKARQRLVCTTHGAEWMENPGPTYGISYNWNAAFSRVTTPWAFCVEDGLRPGMGWLETAVDAVERIGNRTWCGHKVGMMGTASLQDWMLALAGVLPTSLSFLDFVKKTTVLCYSAFWGGADWPNWNDGFWCWKRILPGLLSACNLPEAEFWPESVQNLRKLVQGLRLPAPYGSHADQLGYRPYDAWPHRRKAACAWFPGAFMLVNMDAWRAVGRFADGCTFFEGHLGIRMAQHGYLSLALDFPPWLHYEGMGFVNAGTHGKRPRDHRPCDGPNSVLLADFGVDGEAHGDLYALVYENFPREKRERIDAQLAEVKLKMAPGWSDWL